MTQQRPRGDFRRESLLKTVLNSVLGTCFNQARLDQRTQILEKRGRPTWGGRKGRSIIKGSHAQGVASAQQQDVSPLTEERAVESFRSWCGVSWPRHLNDGRLRPGTRQRPVWRPTCWTGVWRRLPEEARLRLSSALWVPLGPGCESDPGVCVCQPERTSSP